MLKLHHLLIALLMIFVSSVMLAENRFEETAALQLTEDEQDWLSENSVALLGINPTMPPFEWIDENGRFQGISADYVKKIEQLTGLNIEVVPNLTWDQVESGLMDGSIDMGSALPSSKESNEHLHFTEPYTSYPHVYVVRKSSLQTDADLKFFSKSRIGTSSNYIFKEILEKKYPNIDLHLFDSPHQGLVALAVGEIEAYIGNLVVLSYLIDHYNLPDIELGGQLEGFGLTSLSMVARKNLPELASILNKAITQIPYEEKVAISRKWLGSQNMKLPLLKDFSETSTTIHTNYSPSKLLIALLFIIPISVTLIIFITWIKVARHKRLTIRNTIILIFYIFTALIASIGILIFILIENEKHVHKIEESYQESFNLALELRQSTYYLTRFADDYVETKDSKYKQYFNIIVEVLEGKRAHPKKIGLSYWDYLAAGLMETKILGGSYSIQDKLSELELYGEELENLKRAKRSTDDLIDIEITAMNASDGLFKDSSGEFRIEGKPDIDLARDLLHGSSHMEAKNQIIMPIDDFFIMLDRRVSNELAVLHERNHTIFISAAIITIITIVFSIYFFFVLKRRVILPLVKLEAGANKIEMGDLSHTINFKYLDEMSSLASAFNSMARSISERTSRMRSVIETAVDAIILIDTKGLIQEFSPSAESIFGYTKEEILGHNISMLMPKSYQTEHDEYISNYLESHNRNVLGKQRELVALRKNGESFPIDLAVAEAKIKGHSYFTGIVRDISQRKHMEEKLKNQKNLLGMLNQSITTFVDKGDFFAAMNEMLDALLTISKSQYGFTGEVLFDDEKKPYFKAYAMTNISWNAETQARYEKHIDKGFEFRNLDTLFGHVMTSRNTVVCNDPISDPRAGGLPEGHPAMHSFLGVPVFYGNELVGMYGVANRADGYDEDLLEFLRPFNSTYGVLIHSQRLLKKDEEIKSELINAKEGTEKVLKDLKVQELRYRTLVGNIPGIVYRFAHDEEFTIQYMSDYVEQISGYPASDFIANKVRTFASIIHPDDVAEVNRTLADGIKSTTYYSLEYRIVHRNGKIHWVYERGQCVKDEDGMLDHNDGFILDITENKKAEQALVESKDAAEHANLAKSQFLSSMSHELRTPLNAIIGLAQLFEYKKELSSEDKLNAGEIHKAGEHLLSLIDEVLDLSKIEGGHIELKMVAVSLSHLLNECMAIIEPLAQSRGIIMDYESSSFINKFVHADYHRLKQVFLNLLSNAVKYNNENGFIGIGCTITDNNSIRISIRDTGEGLSQKQQEELFQPFNRLGAKYEEIEGTGIGLVITKNLVELMNGKIGVKSHVKVGSTFWVEFDLGNISEKNHSIDVVESKLDTVETLSIFMHSHILIAEDNEANKLVLQQQMELIGLSADFVKDGKKAWEMFNKQEYDLLLTDIHMPSMDGYELVDKIRNAEQGMKRRMPIIALTANAMPEDEKRCLESGMDAYIRKPVRLENLRAILAKWLSVSQTKKTKLNLDKKINDINEVKLLAELEYPVDMAMVIEIIGDNYDQHCVLFKSFVKSTSEIIKEMQSAYNHNDLNKIKQLAHKLKSSSRSVGAPQLAEICEILEIVSEDTRSNDIDNMINHISELFCDVEIYMEEYCASDPST